MIWFGIFIVAFVIGTLLALAFFDSRSSSDYEIATFSNSAPINT